MTHYMRAHLRLRRWVLMGQAAPIDEGGSKREMMINDVSHAYFYAKFTRCIYIELPAEEILKLNRISLGGSDFVFMGRAARR